MRFLRNNTASIVTVGPFYDKTDGVTIENALTITNERITLTADTDDGSAPTLILDNITGATSGTSNDLNYITSQDAGLMQLELSAANLNRLGRIFLSVTDAANHVPVFHEFMILTQEAFDTLFAGTGIGLRADIRSYLGTASPAADTAGYPKVTVKSGSGTGEISLSSGQVAISASSENSIADKVFDEALSGHVAVGSFGAAVFSPRSNTAQAGAATTITLDASASAVNDFYNNQLIHIVSGTGAGQGRIISDYDGTTKVATVSTWATNPSSDSVFVIRPFGSIPGASAPTAAEVADAVCDEALSGHLVSGSLGQALASLYMRTATAQAGASSSITLDASASATDDLYNFNYISILSGTGAGQTRQIIDYVGSSKIATVNLAWAVNPSSDSVFFILPGGLDAATVATIATGVWAATRAGNATAGSFGEYTFSDAIRFSGDSTAADNAEAFFDGTGYAGTNNVIPTVTTVSGSVGSVTGAVGSVTALAANSVNASALAADAVTEIQSGLALAADLATVDTVVDAIKAKTDSLVFTVANQVDANMQAINNEQLLGDGSAGDKWRPTP